MMKSQPEVLRDRVKQFAMQIGRLVRVIPKNDESRMYSNNWRCCGRS